MPGFDDAKRSALWTQGDRATAADHLDSYGRPLAGRDRAITRTAVARGVMRTAVTSTAIAASTASVVAGGYLGVLTTVAIMKSPPAPKPGDMPAVHRRFAVCVPAHDEQSVIVDTVHALLRQDYPGDLFDVHVVADNCTDSTAQRASAAGAEVHVRETPDQRGKGPALNWLIERLDGAYDVIVIVDADTVADEGFLAAMNRAFDRETLAAQGSYGVKDPEQSPTIGLRYAALACRHHLRPLARTAIGGSCGLFGNGMAFRPAILERHEFSGHLTEDAELQLELLLDGVRVAYVPDARVLAEMPASLADSTSQHERWELGRMQLTRRFTSPLLRRFVAGGPLPRRAYADALADLLMPALSALAAFQTGAIALSSVALTLRPSRSGRLALVGSAGSLAVLMIHVMVGLRLVHAPRHIYQSLAHAPRLVVWKIALLGRVARRPATVSWIRTTRQADLGAR